VHSLKNSTVIVVGLSIMLLLVPGFGTISPALVVRAQTPPVFKTPINISNDKGSAQDPNIQNIGSQVYVVWTERSGGIRFRESPDGGVTWNPPLNMSALRISNLGGSTQYPLMSENGTNVYVTWAQPIGATGLQIMEATSKNSGVSFNPPVQLTNGSAPFGFIGPAIASWGNNVYVGYDNTSDGHGYGNEHAFVTCSSDAGATWTHPFHYGFYHEAQIAASEGKYVYAIADGSLVVSSDNCATWTTMNVGHIGAEAWLGEYSTNAYASWETKGSNGNVQVTSSHDNGSTWSNVVNLTVTNAWAPMIGSFGNSAWIALQTHPGSSASQIYVSTTTNNGTTWSIPTSLSGTPARGSDTSFPFTVATSDGQNVFVAWSQQISSGYWIMRIASRADGGSTWSSTPSSPASATISQNVKGQAGNNNDVATGAISAFGTHCYVVWQFISGGSNQIYFSSS
jgi:hypothetical protein